MKQIDIPAFRDFGYLQEANRQFFHPLGLALMIVLDDDTGEASIGGVLDARDDPEGWIYADGDIDPDKARRVLDEQDRRAADRRTLLGYVIQPVPDDTASKGVLNSPTFTEMVFALFGCLLVISTAILVAATLYTVACAFGLCL